MRIALLLFLLFGSSCKNEGTLNNKLIGGWVIDELWVNDTNVVSILSVNVLNFYEDGSCRLPDRLTGGQNVPYDRNGTYELIKENSQYKLIIQTDIPTFNGKFQFEFQDQCERCNYVIVASNSNTKLVATEMWYDSDKR